MMPFNVESYLNKIFYFTKKQLGISLFTVDIEIKYVSKNEKSYAYNNYDDKIKIYHREKAITKKKCDYDFFLVYALGHELAHIILGKSFGKANLPPVAWDEIWAHFCSIDIFLPLFASQYILHDFQFQYYSNEDKRILDQKRNVALWSTEWLLNEGRSILKNIYKKSDFKTTLNSFSLITNSELSSEDCYFKLFQYLNRLNDDII